MSSTVLITGGAGFIGSHLAEAYLGEGRRVVVVDDLSTGKRENVPEKAIFYPVDIRDQSSLRAVFEAEKPNIVSHHAAQMSVKNSTNDPAHDASINVMGLLNVFQLSLENRVSKLIFSSSGGTVYGEAERVPTPETALLAPRSPYGISKMVAEHYLRYYGEEGLSWTIFRYGNVYGPRQMPHGEAGVVSIFAQGMLDGRLLQIHGDGEQIKDYVFVGDVVRANLMVSETEGGEVFNLGGSPASVREIFEKLASIADYRLAPERGPARKGDIRRSFLDLGNAERKLDWRPRVSLAQGLEMTYRYFAASRK
ncbi:MAG TPA: UDP-glucose 4-epimerase [Cyanobacteria bacterium UBA8530]|nr:UDP-glucose 4-epimerase [Cyanobacteria bacterium UBA8530]